MDAMVDVGFGEAPEEEGAWGVLLDPPQPDRNRENPKDQPIADQYAAQTLQLLPRAVDRALEQIAQMTVDDQAKEMRLRCTPFTCLLSVACATAGWIGPAVSNRNHVQVNPPDAERMLLWPTALNMVRNG